MGLRQRTDSTSLSTVDSRKAAAPASFSPTEFQESSNLIEFKALAESAADSADPARSGTVGLQRADASRRVDSVVSPAVAHETAGTALPLATRIATFEQPATRYPAIRVAYQETPKSIDDMGTQRDYQLQNLTLDEFENRMLAVWGNRLRVDAENNGQRVKIVLPTFDRNAGAMTIDRISARIIFDGPQSVLGKWRRAMVALDSKMGRGEPAPQILDTQNAEAATIQKAVAIMETVQIAAQESGNEIRRAIPLDRNPDKSGIVGAPQQDPTANNRGNLNQRPLQGNGQDQPQDQEGLTGPVRIEVIPELNLLILYGKEEDVAYVQKVLANLIKSADAAQPDIEPYPLKFASGQSIAPTLQTLYDNNFAAQQGPVSITALEQPNGLLLIGRKENIEMAKKLIESMDVAAPDQPEQFRTFRLKYMSAIDAQARLNSYFAQQQQQAAAPGAAAAQTVSPVTIVADYRSNSLIVKSGAANLALVEKLLNELDVVDSPAKNEVRVIPIHNAVASDLAITLQDAINGQLTNSGNGYKPQNQGAGAAQGAGGAQNQVQAQAPGDPTTESRIRSAMLELMTVDKNGNPVNSGILFDVRITSDANSNSLVVTGPSRSMNLIEALVERLDVVPDIEIKIKVFRLVHGDAPTLLAALQQLFGASTTQAGGGGAFGQTNQLQSQLPLQSSSAQDGATLAGLRFSIDERTNTLIVSGPAGDLQVIEDLIIRLDEDEVDLRSIRVYRLSNAPAEDVAQALNSYIESRREIILVDPASISLFEQVRRELIVIPEIVSNSLLISATPQYFAELEPVIQALDRRPSMVKVKVLIAQVTLNELDEFGVEIGLQDSLLFDRGIGVIGFPFNQQGLGNNSTALSLGTREDLAGQALSNLSIGRTNSSVGYGGLMLSAGNESINVLIRALQDRNVLRVLAKPHITTVDNLLARVQVGQQVPTVTAVNQTNAGGFSNSVEYTSVGIILEITPRVSPDGTIIMLVNATNSSLGDVDAGIPIFSDANGNVIRSPIINETTAETTIMARSGQTVVLSGLLQENKADARRGIPILSDLPVLGPLFRFDSEQEQRSELLIVMTPYLVDGDEEIDTHNHTEYDRMHWCLGDVNEIYGSLDYEPQNVTLQNVEQPAVYYPDADPMGQQPQYESQRPERSKGPQSPPGPDSSRLDPPIVDPNGNLDANLTPNSLPTSGPTSEPNSDEIEQPKLLDASQRVPMSSLQPATQNRTTSLTQNNNSGTRIPATMPALPNSPVAQSIFNAETASWPGPTILPR